jgi:hypothetical protein
MAGNIATQFSSLQRVGYNYWTKLTFINVSNTAILQNFMLEKHQGKMKSKVNVLV